MIFFEFAKRNIRLHWLRSLLAVIGIIIGVVAISSMGILGNSLVLSVSDALSDVGDTIVVTPHTGGGGGFGGPPGSGTASTASSGISDQDIAEIARIVAPNSIIPLYTGGDRFVIGSKTGAASIYGMRPDDIPVLLEKEDGIYLKGGSSAMVGSRLAKEFNLKVGNRIAIGTDQESVRIVGILKERGAGLDINPDFAIIVSDRWFASTYETEEWNQAIVKVRDIDTISAVKTAIENRFNRREQVLNVMDTKAILESIFDAFNQISTFTLAIGGISLIVAGVSILNVMMMSVTERTREIGVMRSIGARRREILKMFVYESLLLGLVGSLVGGLLSFAGGYAILLVILQDSSYLFEPSSLLYILYGMGFGIATSVLSGFYPAWKASTLNPIEALRHD
jgi:putative ABC transport system permease protein